MFKKILSFAALLVLLPSLALASYTIVLKDGTRYRAKEKWKVSGGKAIVTLENGTTLSLDPKLIDQRETDRVNASGLGDAKVIPTAQPSSQPQQPQQSPLGSITTLKRPTTTTEGSTTKTGDSSNPNLGQTNLSNDVLMRFQQAYENVGLYDAKVIGGGRNALRVELTADNEDQVFKAISATSFLVTKIPEITGGERVELVELFMKTINGGSAGRFQMTAADAQAISSKQISWQEYFVSDVIF
jgi:hypothetical protein